MACGDQIEVVRYHTSAASVAEALCQRAKDLNVSAVVIASHNKTALKVSHRPLSLLWTQ